ncbi:MAG: hypothetical protein J6J23_07370 [Clostridia bacterium]|nr:hypothetical protein [Clostridia bacterium]
MTNFNYGVCDRLSKNLDGGDYIYETITNGLVNSNNNKNVSEDDLKPIQNITNLKRRGNRSRRSLNREIERVYCGGDLGLEKTLNVADFVCETPKNDGIIKTINNDNMSSQIVTKREDFCSTNSNGVGVEREMADNLLSVQQNRQSCESMVADGDLRRSESENLSPVQQMNLLIQAEKFADCQQNESGNLKKAEDGVESLHELSEGLAEENLCDELDTSELFDTNKQNNSSTCGRVDTLKAGQSKAGFEPSELQDLILEVGGVDAVNERLKRVQEENVERLKDKNVIEGEREGLAVVDPNKFSEVIQVDQSKIDAIFDAFKKPYKCDLLNMKLERWNVKNWETVNWVKFFLKSVKSASFTLRYYDRLFDRQVKNSFYSEHIAKFGSIENFFESIAELIERKQKMQELKSFSKRLYKELTELEILIVDKFVFGADTVGEITKEISLRTMYRKADKIIPKLVKFMDARGYTPNWCYKKFGSIIR